MGSRSILNVTSKMLVTLYLLLMLLSASNVQADDILSPDDPLVVLKGQMIYESECAECHGSNLEGQADWQEPEENSGLPAPPHSTDGYTWRQYSSQQLLDILKYGVQYFAGRDYPTEMPVFGEWLSDEELIAVLSYIKSTWPEDVRAYHDTLGNPE